TITARAVDSKGAIGQAQLTFLVAVPPHVGILAPVDQAIVFTADLPNLNLLAIAGDLEDGDLAARVKWNSDLDGNLGTGAQIAGPTLRIGAHTITASVTDNDGLQNSAVVHIRVRGPNQPPHVTITAPHDGGSVAAGTPVTLTATATDDFDGDLTTGVVWKSDKDGALGPNPQTLTLSEGTHHLTASVVDSDNAKGEATITFQVAPTPPVVTFAAPANNTRVFVGTSVTFGGSAVDATDGNVTETLRWTSDRDGVIGTGPSFATTHLSIGTHVVTAAANDTGGLIGQAQRTIVIRPLNAPPVVTIISPANNAGLLAAKPVVLGATALDV